MTSKLKSATPLSQAVGLAGVVISSIAGTPALHAAFADPSNAPTFFAFAGGAVAAAGLAIAAIQSAANNSESVQIVTRILRWPMRSA